MSSGQAVRTFLFTDIEASTRRWEHDPAAMSAALERHDTIVRTAVEANAGELVKHTGDGVVAVFEVPSDALRAAVAIQRGLGDDVRVRAGIHTGPAEQRAGDWFGPTLNRAARIMALGRGGHVLLSATVAGAVTPDLPDAVTLLDLGEHPLKGFERPERIHQAVGAGLTADRAFEAGAERARRSSRSSFIGRETEIDAVSRLLDTERCVTVTGVGGSGKTRLALEVAQRRADRYPDGLAVAELAALADGAEVARAVADAVAMPIVGGSVARDLTIFLRDREVLLVIDNCEHLLDGCAELIEDLIDGCPDVTILATSREPLGVDGERAWRAPSLSLPTGPDADPLDCEAAALFVARAASAQPGFVAADHREAVGSICLGLDGLPLAIELAAARTSHLTPEQIAEMLDDRFRLLTGGTRRARQRQQTLQAAMDWSHDLLTAEEQRLLRRLAVFAGGWTLDAATDVAGDGDAIAVVDGLGSLVAKSLVMADETEAGMRYRMLETVRLYAQERLVDAGEAIDRRDRHVEWLIRRGDAERSRHGDRWISKSVATTEAEVDNLRVALDWSAEQGRGEDVVRLILLTWPMWYVSLRAPEALTWLDRYAGAVDESLGTRERVEWRIAGGFLRQEAMDAVAIVRAGNEALRLDPDGRASDFTGLAWFLRMILPVFVDPPAAVRMADEATAWVAEHSSGDVADFVVMYAALAHVAARQWDRGRELLVQAGGADDVIRFYGEIGLITVPLLLGDAADARARASALAAELGPAPARHLDTSALGLLAITEAASGDPRAARAALAGAATTARRRYTHIPSAWGLPITAAAAVLAIEGRDSEAMTLLVAVGAHGRVWQARQEMFGLLHREYSRNVADRLGPEATAQAWIAGEAMSVEDMQAAVDALVAEA